MLKLGVSSYCKTTNKYYMDLMVTHLKNIKIYVK